MPNHQHRTTAARRLRSGIVAGLAAVGLAACGGGGGGDETGGNTCLGVAGDRSHPLAAGDRHVLACSTNGLPPGGIDGLGVLIGFGFVDTSPADRGAGVATTTIVRATFNKPVAVAPTVIVRDSTGRAVAGSVVVDGADILFRPSAPLSPATTYSVVVDGGISVAGDNACGFGGFAGTCHLEFSFTTA